jgi:hypothetical protein
MPTTDGNPNVNRLAGMRCPSCGDFGPFAIQATQSGVVRVSDNGTEFIDGNVEWEDESECECLACRRSATVAEFRGKPKPAFDAQQTLVLNTYANGEFAHIIPGQEGHCGDTLLKFLLVEVSGKEDCEIAQTAVDRLTTAILELTEVREAFEQLSLEG